MDILIYIYLGIVYLSYLIVITIIGNIKTNNKEYLLGGIILSIPTIITLSYSEPLGQLIFIIGSTILVYSAQKTFFISCVISISTMLFIILFTETYGYCLSLIENVIIFNDLINNNLINLISQGIMLILLYMISKFIQKYILERFEKSNIIRKKSFKFLIVIFGAITFMLIYGSLIYVGLGHNVAYLFIFIFVLVFIFFLIIIYVVYSSSFKEEKILRKQLELEQLKLYTENLEYIYNEMRKIRHDYMNVLASMTGYMEDRNMDALIEYFENNIIPFSDKMNNQNSKLGQLSYLKQSEIKGLIALQIIKAQELKIEVEVDIVESIEFLEFEPIDLCRVIGILLDNAIEGAVVANEPIIQLGFIKKRYSKLIVVRNTCKNNNVSVYKLYEKGYSSKGNNRGLGLSNLKEIINKYECCNIDTFIEEGMFNQVIECSMAPTK